MNEISGFLQDILLEPDRLVPALFAVLVVIVVGAVSGPVTGSANPFFWFLFDKLFGGIGKRLENPRRRQKDLMFRGFLFMLLVVTLSWFAGVTLYDLLPLLPLSSVWSVAFLSSVLTAGTVWFMLLRLYYCLKEKKGGDGTYRALALSTRDNLSGRDDYAVTRTAMMFAARSFDKGLVTPVFWYLIAGLPGAFIYAALAALVWRYGRDGYTGGFGRIPLMLEKILGFIPHVLTGFLIACAGLFTPTGGLTRALLGQVFGKGRATYAEGGLPLTALAYALDVSLGGPVYDLEGHTVKRAWIGPKNATAQLSEGHIRRALYISLIAHMLFVLGLLALMIFAGA